MGWFFPTLHLTLVAKVQTIPSQRGFLIFNQRKRGIEVARVVESVPTAMMLGEAILNREGLRWLCKLCSIRRLYTGTTKESFYDYCYYCYLCFLVFRREKEKKEEVPILLHLGELVQALNNLYQELPKGGLRGNGKVMKEREETF